MSRHARRSKLPGNLQRRVDEFNAVHPVGSPMWYRSHPSAAGKTVVTTAPAYLLMGHTAVVMVTDVRGCVALDALDPVI